jgi:hypothetical protein
VSSIAVRTALRQNRSATRPLASEAIDLVQPLDFHTSCLVCRFGHLGSSIDSVRYKAPTIHMKCMTNIRQTDPRQYRGALDLLTKLQPRTASWRGEGWVWLAIEHPEWEWRSNVQ